MSMTMFMEELDWNEIIKVLVFLILFFGITYILIVAFKEPWPE